MAQKRLIILGAGGFGREVLNIALYLSAGECAWQLAGFLDDMPDRAGEELASRGYPWSVLGTISDYEPRGDDVFVPAVGSPAARLEVCERMRSRGGRFINLIHPTAVTSPDVRLGQGIVIQPFVFISAGACVGDFVIINAFSSIGHDSQIEDGCTISSHCDVTGGACLERGSFLGSHASILPGVRVGSFAKVGAGSVAIRQVPPGCTLMGVPGKVLFQRGGINSRETG